MRLESKKIRLGSITIFYPKRGDRMTNPSVLDTDKQDMFLTFLIDIVFWFDLII